MHLVSRVQSESESESKKLDKYVDLVRRLKKLWNMKLAVIAIITESLGTVCRNLENRFDELEIRGRIEIIQATALLTSAWTLRRVPKTSRVLLSMRLH